MKLGCNYCPQRYVLAFMSFLGHAFLYVVRGSLSITLKKLSIYNQTSSNGSTCIQCDECFEKLPLSDQERLQIFVIFYIGYITCQIPGAVLIKRFGGKIVLGLGAAITSILALLLPYAVCYSKYTQIAVVISTGVSMSVNFTSTADLLARWAPSNELTLLSAIVFGGIQVGMANIWMLLWIILDHIKWQNMFIILGAVGIVWCLLWSVLVYDSPDNHPYIAAEERKLIIKFLPEINKDMPTPWRAILKSKPVWAVIISFFGERFEFCVFTVYLPQYYNDDPKISYFNNGDLVVMPYLLMWPASVLLGFLSDKIIHLKWTSTTQLRRILATIGAIAPGIGMICASHMPNNTSKLIIVTMFMSSMSFCFCSMRVNPLDLSRNHAAIILALANTCGNIASAVAPVVLYAIIAGSKNAELTELRRKWQDMFWIMFAVSVLANIPFLIYSSGEIQPWDNPNKPRRPSYRPRISTVSSGQLSINS